MKRILLSILMGCSLLLPAIAGEPIKKPLTFVPSDSIVVWGEDRSDFRSTALSVAPQLFARPVTVSKLNKQAVKEEVEEWQKQVLPKMNLMGSIADELGKTDVIATTEMVKKGAKLFLSTADAQYMDVVERASLNALQAVLEPGALSFEKHIAAQTMMNVSGMIYAVDEEGVFVNLYINNSTHILTDKQNFIIDQLTAMPHSSRVKLRISALKNGGTPIKLRLRMPDWALGKLADNSHFALSGAPQQLPTIYVNGREEEYLLERGYLVIDRRWNSGDEVFFDFPFKVQYLQPCREGKMDESLVTLQRGPLVYGFQAPTEDFVFVKSGEVKEEVEPNAFGHSMLTVPVKDKAGKSGSRKAEPFMDGARYTWMNATK